MYFWKSFAFSMIQLMLAIWSLLPLPFRNPIATSGNSQVMYCWSLAWRIFSITSMDEFEWTPGAGDRQGGLVCCNSWGRKESDTTEQLNWTELNWVSFWPGFDFWVRKILCRRKWQPTPVFSPGESHWQSSLAGYGPWDLKSRTQLSD